MSKTHEPTENMLAIIKAAAHAWRDGVISVNDSTFVQVVFMSAVDMVAFERASVWEAIHSMIGKLEAKGNEQALARYISNLPEVRKLTIEEVI